MISLRVSISAEREPWRAEAAALSAVPWGVMEIIGGGDSLPVARMVTLWLQSFDNQPGISLSYRQLDYGRVIDWLDEIVRLDPHGQYPLLLASRIYGEVSEPVKQRQMAEWVYRQFFGDPQRRWRWLAHSITVARHQLEDFPLALRYAKALAQADAGLDIPVWARQMETFLLDDMGEHERAAIMLGGLIDSGVVTDPAELRFLLQRLAELRREIESSMKLEVSR